MATKHIAQWVVDLQTVPSTTRRAALRSLYNYIGCAVGGSNHPAVSKAHNALSPFFGPATSSLLGHQKRSRTDAQHAALLNGIASHVHDYDDTHLATIIHPTGPIASALLAWAEYQDGVSGEELLVALTVGIEVSCKLGLAVWPTHYDVGWHITSTTGVIGAAMAVGKLMGLKELELSHALGIAAVQVIGLREMFGSDTKSFHPGRAASSGLLAAVMARGGYTSSESALEAKRGWANVVAGGGTPRLDELVATLGETWEIEANSFKPFPCGIVCHPAIDAAIRCHGEMQERRLSPAAVKSVKLRVHPLVVELTSKARPKNGLEAKFSVFHGCAVGLLYGRAGPAQYADDVVASQAVIAVRDRIEIVSDDSLAADEVYLALHHEDGTNLDQHIEHAIGSVKVPMTDVQLTEKFVDQVAPVLGDRGARTASTAAWSIGEAEDITQVMQILKAAEAAR